MSGDVQPRKRKDKKRKKDELGIEEPRGTAAALGEGDVFMHSQNEHGTGGHWCAKIIFFSLLAVLVGLIGLIILENRGLTELEANSIESRYSGVLEGWLEDAPEDDHHDEHTLELKHVDEHEDDDEIISEQHTPSNDEDENEDGLDEEDDDIEQDSNEENKSNRDDDDDHEANDDVSENLEGDNDDQESQEVVLLDDNDEHNDNNDSQDEDDDDEHDVDNNDKDDGEETETNEQGDSIEDLPNQSNEDEDDSHEEIDDLLIEKIEREPEDLEPISAELPALLEENDNGSQEEYDNPNESHENDDEAPDDEDNGGFLEDDDDDDEDYVKPTVILRMSAGKPYVEVEESSEQLTDDTLADEEEYEKRQEELRRQEEKASHLWLKLGVGAALLGATHALVRRATRTSHGHGETEEEMREDTPSLVDRRMTLLPDEPSIPATSETKSRETVQSKTQIERAVEKKENVTFSTLPTYDDEDEEVVDEEEPEDIDNEIVDLPPPKQGASTKEVYSDEDEEEEVEEREPPKPSPTSLPAKDTKEPESDDALDDVEIIDEEAEQEVEDEEDAEEEEISDVDDVELLTRLEAKYGRLPEPERPGQRHKDGGNSVENWWPGEPSDAHWRNQLNRAQHQLDEGSWAMAAELGSVEELRGSARARWLVARALDASADQKRDNRLLTRAIDAYMHLLKLSDGIPDDHLLAIARRTLDRIHFRGNYLSAEPVHRLLIRRFPNDPGFRNNLTISLLMANRADLAEEVLKETLLRWPDDKVALAHYGFVLKTQHNRLDEAVNLFQRALDSDEGPANEPRFYYHLGDALLLLGRADEAHEVHKRGAALGHFLSPSQRSLYNVPRLKSHPWWDVAQTPYNKLARELENSWRKILREGEEARALYEQEKEGLREKGEWSQLDLFVRGQEVAGGCERAPVTCRIIRSEPAAAGCRRGQIKFSLMAPGTHVRPHVGPTNCRLRMHLGLSNTTGTHLRVDTETRQWHVGKVLMFDDSFEHEVWHNGTDARLVLIVDVWHPSLSPAERRQLPAI